MPENTVTLTDNRTNQTYTFELVDGQIRASDLRKVKIDPEDFGMMSYDPAFMNTASCQSRITFIDGEKGILRVSWLPDRRTRPKMCTSLKWPTW